MTPPPGAPPPTRQLTREQLARAIGKDERTVRRWERTRLAPAVSVGADGVHRFDMERVRELIEIRERSVPTRPDAYDGEMAREAFGLFDENVHPVDVVKRTGFDPRAVEAMYQKWTSLRGGFFVPAEIAAKINSLVWFTGPSLAFGGSAETLLKCVESMRPKERCSVCEHQLPELCAECAKETSVKEARRRD
jgi:hypothetical protein